LEYLVTELEDKLGEEIFLRFRATTRVAEIATEHGVVAMVTFFPVGVTNRRDTMILVRLNPKYQAYKVWFTAAFAGIKQRYRELKPQLTLSSK
jgi:hypothetical protein